MEKIGDAAFAYDAENEKVLKDAEAEIARRIEEVLESGKATDYIDDYRYGLSGYNGRKDK